jgi:hypothetical protein
MASDIERLDGNAWRRGCKSFCPAPGEAARPRFLEERPRPLCTPRCPCRADPLYPVPHSVSASFTVWAWRTPTGLHLELGGPYLSFHQAFRCASATCGASATRRGSPFTIRGFYTPASVPAWLSVPLSPTVDFETVYPREATTDHGTMVQCRCGPCGRYTAQAWIPGATLPMCDPCRIAYTPGRGGRGHCHLHYPEITADPVTEVRLSAVVAWDWLVFLEAMLLSRSCELHTRGLCRWNITLIAEFAAGPPEAEMAVIDTAGTGLLQCGQSKRLADRQPDAWTYAPNEWKLCLATGPHSPPTHTHIRAPHAPAHTHTRALAHAHAQTNAAGSFSAVLLEACRAASCRLPGLREYGALLFQPYVHLQALTVLEGELRKPERDRRLRVGERYVDYGQSAWWGWVPRDRPSPDTTTDPVLRRILQHRPPQTILRMVQSPPFAFTALGVRRLAAVREETFGGPWPYRPLRSCPQPTP